MIDPLNIFPMIKKAVNENFSIVSIYAIGSRARGSSNTGKWDFDVAIVSKDIVSPGEIKEVIQPLFDDMLDEFNKPVKIDFWVMPQEKFTQKSLTVFKTHSNAILL